MARGRISLFEQVEEGPSGKPTGMSTCCLRTQSPPCSTGPAEALPITAARLLVSKMPVSEASAGLQRLTGVQLPRARMERAAHRQGQRAQQVRWGYVMVAKDDGGQHATEKEDNDDDAVEPDSGAEFDVALLLASCSLHAMSVAMRLSLPTGTRPTLPRQAAASRKPARTHLADTMNRHGARPNGGAHCVGGPNVDV